MKGLCRPQNEVMFHRSAADRAYPFKVPPHSWPCQGVCCQDTERLLYLFMLLCCCKCKDLKKVYRVQVLSFCNIVIYVGFFWDISFLYIASLLANPLSKLIQTTDIGPVLRAKTMISGFPNTELVHSCPHSLSHDFCKNVLQ